jgi:hypothetical protein
MDFVQKLEHVLFEDAQDELRPGSQITKLKLADLLRSGIPFVVVGARAVNVYINEPRNTQDIDILTNQYDELAEWTHREYPDLEMQTSELVIRFSDGSNPILDIMKPNDETFQHALKDTKQVGKFQVVSPEALIAMKFGAIMSGHRKLARKAQDRVDIGNILDNTKVDLRKSAQYVQHLFPGATHAFAGIIKKIKEDFGLS